MKPTLLCILDGFGLNPNSDGNAVALARKPVFDALWSQSAHTTLVTFGEAVGLPAGQMGNSEVGHLNIGAGRVVEQWLLRISRALAGDFLDHSKEYQAFLSTVRDAPTIHVVGLCSTGGVHSHADHLKLLLKRLSRDLPTQPVALHLVSDGRDVSPTAFEKDLEDLLSFLKDYPKVSIRSICGRFFAMDRDKRWERVQTAYNAIALGEGVSASDPREFIKASYAHGTTDEFIEPGVVETTTAGARDAWIFFNFREDRMRELVAALCAENFTGFERRGVIPPRERVLCFTEYDHSFHLPFLFPQLDIRNHLGEVIAGAGIPQLRVAETEKYPHVTYFLNGGIEKEYAGEERKLVPSPRDVKTYDLKPEMSACGVAELVKEGLAAGKYGLVVVNFANCDMVGHTGVVEAGVRAVETVDTCLGEILEVLKSVGGQALIIADHGNAEQMMNYVDRTPHTAHTTYPVPAIVVGVEGCAGLRDGGALCDVAPTVLEMMGLPRPAEMTGRSLLNF
jgi:2,3-bisphosphoglycerate-independent phosphoglycerate mutase